MTMYNKREREDDNVSTEMKEDHHKSNHASIVEIKTVMIATPTERRVPDSQMK